VFITARPILQEMIKAFLQAEGKDWLLMSNMKTSENIKSLMKVSAQNQNTLIL
jgi:hypothetical protein